MDTEPFSRINRNLEDDNDDNARSCVSLASIASTATTRSIGRKRRHDDSDIGTSVGKKKQDDSSLIVEYGFKEPAR